MNTADIFCNSLYILELQQLYTINSNKYKIGEKYQLLKNQNNYYKNYVINEDFIQNNLNFTIIGYVW